MNIKYPTLALLLSIGGCATLEKETSINDPKYQARQKLVAFKSDRQAADFIFSHNELIRKSEETPPAVATSYPGEDGEYVMVSGIRGSLSPSSPLNESITNNQEAGVDEGDIVKIAAGRFLIVLRQGRLYSIDIGAEAGSPLQKIDQIDVSPPTWKHEAWYDELLVNGNTLLVIGFSYEAKASELAFFTLNNDGTLDYRKTYLISSSDYYSEKNYAGRLVDGNLVMYMPDYAYDESSTGALEKSLSPQISLIDLHGKVVRQYPLFRSHRIYRPVQRASRFNMFSAAVCPLQAEPFTCHVRSILGDHIDGYYVSGEALYMWAHSAGWAVDTARVPLSWLREALDDGSYHDMDNYSAHVIYRFPLKGGDIGGLKVVGEPLDQFSFMEKDASLYIFGRKPAGPYEDFEAGRDAGESFWAEIPLAMFNRGLPSLPASNIHPLPDFGKGDKLNRFIGDYLVYANSHHSSSASLAVSKLDGVSDPVVIEQNYHIDQIQPIGANALLLESTRDSVAFSSLALSDHIAVVDTLDKTGGEFSEERSHSFNYRALGKGGLFGVPAFIEQIEQAYKNENGKRYDYVPAVDMLYYGVTPELSLYEAGSLPGDTQIQWEETTDCEVSCYDWYGSSRPFFIGNRIFALLKNELVEGYISSHSVHEKQRINVFKDKN